MDATEPQPVPPVHKLRWYQFSLRSLMIFVLVCGVLLGWSGTFFLRLHQQREAVSRIRGLGGLVQYDYQWREGNLDYHASPPGPKVLRMMLGDDAFAHVAKVNFCCQDFSSFNSCVNPLKYADLKALEALHDLDTLGILDSNIGDEGLQHLAALGRLRALDLESPKIGDQGLEHLRGLTNLRIFKLSRGKFSDKGIEQLKGLKNLESLNLSDTQVTTEGVARLSAATTLRELVFYGFGVNDSTLRRLDALKGLKVLQLVRCSVTDAGLTPLEHLTRLRELQLNECHRISDAGLGHLRRLSNLETLFVSGAEISDSGLRKFARIEEPPGANGLFHLDWRRRGEEIARSSSP